MRRSRAAAAAAAAVALLGTATACAPAAPRHAAAARVSGALAPLLSAATDLGVSRRTGVAVDVALPSRQRPTELADWAGRHGLHVRWQPGQNWAGVAGSAERMAQAFATPIHDYRDRSGVRFYAATRDVPVPEELRGDVVQVGHIVSYVPSNRTAVPGPGVRADVPPDGLSPQNTLQAYQATSLARAGYTGKGDTVVFFEWSPAVQSDLDAFASKFNLPPLRPTVIGSFPQEAHAEDETIMDVEVVHALAPDAKLVIVDATPVTNANDGATLGQNWAQLFTRTEQQFPGSVWSLSISNACNEAFNQADVLPIENALEAAEAKGTTAYLSSGDTSGLECKQFREGGFAAPPTQADVGVIGMPNVPAMTVVGGTLISVDRNGDWASEQTWDDSAAQQGTGGGIDTNWPRPSWQRAQGIENVGDSTHRIVPDIAADADPASGMATVSGGQLLPGGGTSQASPIWAAFTVLINEYLRAHGGHNVGAINPLLYEIARGAARPAFHDITLGGNAVFKAGPGYDPVTGLGTPDVTNLAADLLDLQKGRSS